MPSDVPNPYISRYKSLRPASKVEIIHPISKEPHLYQLLEYQYGDYVLKYATADFDLDGDMFKCVWRKTEPLTLVDEEQRLVLKTEKAQIQHQYGVYHSVSGIEDFVNTYKAASFHKLWTEYDAFLKEKFGRLCIPLLPGNEKEQAASVFDVYEVEPIDDFVTLYTLCDGNDTDEWLNQIDKEGAAYAHIGGNPLMNLNEIAYEVKYAGRNVVSKYPIQSIPSGYVKNNEMLSNKIPIHHDGGGNFIAIDLDPDVNGQYGQIVEVDHEYDERVVLASSLKEYITILYYFVKELGAIDNGEGFEGEKPLSSYIRRK